MNKISFLFLFALLAIISCGKPKDSNISVNNQTNSVNSNISLPNSNTNISTNILQNSKITAENNSQVNTEMLKQIEAQQLETADPRKTAKKEENTNNNQTPKKTAGSPQRQTW